MRTVEQILDAVQMMRRNGVPPDFEDGSYRLQITRSAHDAIVAQMEDAYNVCLAEGGTLLKLEGATIEIVEG